MTGPLAHRTTHDEVLWGASELRAPVVALRPRTTQISLSATGVVCRLCADEDPASARVVIRVGKLGT